MELRDFLNLYGGHTKVCVNDDNLRRVFIGNIFAAKICDYKHCEVVSFGFYDNELGVRVREGK